MKIKIRDQMEGDVYYLDIPDDVLSEDEHYLLKCANNNYFWMYCYFRDFDLLYMVSGLIFHMYEEYLTKHINKNDIDIYLYPDTLSAGFDMNDPSEEDLLKLLNWCKLREDELKSRGWKWGIKWNGYASCHIKL